MTDRRGEEPVTRVEFTVDDSSYPFVSASETPGCEVEMAEMIPHDENVYAEFFNVTGVSPKQVQTFARDHDSVEATLIREYENGGLFEFLVEDNCPAVALAEQGALPRSIRATDGTGHIVAEVPGQYDACTVIDGFLQRVAEAELVCKREQDSVTPLFTDTAVQQVLDAHLTDRQREVLCSAFEHGYYEWPRQCTGEEVAAELDISSATFSEHIHAAERKLLTVLFDNP